jgi:hypothetical protein
MTIPIVKQTITGSELPTGDLYSYCRGVNDNAVYLTHCSTAGVISRQSISPFPPSSFTLALNELVTARYNYGNNAPLQNVTKFAASGIVGNYGLFGFIANESALVAVYNYQDSSGAVYATESEVAGSPTLLYVHLASANNYIMWHGLGKDELGVDNFRIRYTQPPYSGDAFIDSTKCIVDSTGVKCFGAWLDPNTSFLYVLLNPTTGCMYSEGDYYNLVMPSGGEIKQFAASCYIATDTLGAMFLYSIEAGGTLIGELSGTYDPSISLEFMGVV